MYRSTSSVVLPLIVGAVLSVVPDVADSQATQTRTGSIVMRVLGAEDNVRFFVDGKQVATQERTASWYAAEAVVDVPAGEHTVEAQFRTPDSGNEGEWNQLSTREPLIVTPGSVTQLDADVKRNASGNPGDAGRYFRVKTTQPSRGAAPLTATAPSRSAPVSTPEATGAVNGGASESKSSTAAVGVAAVPTITIVGNDVISDGKPASAAPDPLADVVAEGLVNDTPTVAELPAPPGEIALVQSGRVEVSFLVQSVPPGADASLDGKLVGKTPLHVKLDPRLDHLLSVARIGCESIVQLLATDAWRAGRPPQALVHLDCK